MQNDIDFVQAQLCGPQFVQVQLFGSQLVQVQFIGAQLGEAPINWGSIDFAIVDFSWKSRRK